MLVAEYDYDLDIEVQREESYNAGMTKGREEGREEGRMQGVHMKAIETARNLIHIGLSLENIAKATGLSVEEVAKL